MIVRHSLSCYIPPWIYIKVNKMNKIPMLCQWMRITLLLLMIASPIAIIVTWLSGAHSDMSIPLRLVSPGSIQAALTTQQKIWGFIISLIPAAFAMGILYAFATVFNQFSKGELFTGHSISGFKWAGALILIWEVFQPMYDMLMGMALTSNHILSTHFVRFDISNIRGLIIGAVLFTMAWALEDARQIKSEHDLTI